MVLVPVASCACWPQEVTRWQRLAESEALGYHLSLLIKQRMDSPLGRHRMAESAVAE